MRLSRLSPAAALLPLRGFLGVTFVYGGVQKLSDPGFLHPGAATYIGTQLHDFAAGTPGGFLLRALAIPHAQPAGIGVALLEIAIGLLVLAGLLTQVAAAAGLGLNLVLFLTASWKTSPYFLGSDIVFVFAWLPFVLAGAAGQPALDALLERRPATAREGAIAGAGGGGVVSRREALGRALGVAGAATAAIAGLAVLFRGQAPSSDGGISLGAGRGAPAGGTGASGAPARGGSGHGGAPAHSGSSAPAASSAAPPSSHAVRLGPASAVGRNQAATYRDPATGAADILVRHSDGGLTALSAICTHAGCPVQYDGSALVCPCHGSVFDARTGAVQQGPATQPLARRQVVERGGQLYAVRA